MDYVQEIYSVLNDSNLSLSGEERTILSKFSDEIVRFKPKSETDYIHNKDLKNAFHKLIDSDLFYRYLQILLRRDSYSWENFWKKIDNE